MSLPLQRLDSGSNLVMLLKIVALLSKITSLQLVLPSDRGRKVAFFLFITSANETNRKTVLVLVGFLQIIQQLKLAHVYYLAEAFRKVLINKTKLHQCAHSVFCALEQGHWASQYLSVSPVTTLINGLIVSSSRDVLCKKIASTQVLFIFPSVEKIAKRQTKVKICWIRSFSI